MKRRVVITGMGTINPIGKSVEETWKSVEEGKCGIDQITAYDVSERKVKLAGEVKDPGFEDVIDKKDLRKMDRYTKLAIMAAEEAMKDAGFLPEGAEKAVISEEDRAHFGVIASSGIGGISTIENEQMRGVERGFDRVSPHYIPTAISNMAAGHIAIRYGLRGMCSCVVTACASSSNAIGDAFRNVRDGYEDIMLCGGAEAAITPLSIGGFTSMKALTTQTDPKRASIPFDKERSGFVMGEGAGMLVIEEYEHAKKRGAKIYGEIVGYGVSCDAYHITAPTPDGSGAAACMKKAIKDAGIEPKDIDYINAHGTSTPMNDKGETAAIKLAFKDAAKDLKISSTKAMTGHLLGASGAVEAVITMKSICESYIPPTINYSVPDEECDLNIVPNEGIHEEIRYAMSNSLGFGGHNASLVFKRFKEA